MNMPNRHARASIAIWAATCVVGFGYWLGALARSGIAFHSLADLPALILVPWKGACTLGLALSVAAARQGRAGSIVAGALTISAIADMLLAAGSMIASGVLFSLSHLIAISVFWQRRDRSASLVRRVAAGMVPVTSFALSLLAIRGTGLPIYFALYPLLSGIMAATAIVSRFPVWLCGLGAVIFICSDVLVVAWLGVLGRDPSLGFLTWLTYFAGYAMIARGAVSLQTPRQSVWTGKTNA